MIETYFIPCFNAFFASMAFAMIFNVRDIKVLALSSFTAAFGWFVYLISAGAFNVVGQNLMASVAVALVSEFLSRIMKTPSTIFIIIGIIPFVPGGGIYYTMEYCVKGDTQMFLEKGLETFAVAGAIAIGVSIASSIFRFYIYGKNKRQKRIESYDRHDI